MKKTFFVLIWVLWLLPRFCFAETIYLKNGRQVNGQVVDTTGKALKINVKGIILTYDMEDIDRVEGATSQQPGVSKSLPLMPLPSQAMEEPRAISPSGVLDITATSSNTSEFDGMAKNDIILSLIEATGAKDNMNQMFNQILSQAKPEEAQQLRDILNVDEVIKQIVPVYDKYFTEEELKGLLAFYKSQAGKKYMTLMPQIMQESMKASMDYFQSKIESASAISPGPASAPSPAPLPEPSPENNY